LRRYSEEEEEAAAAAVAAAAAGAAMAAWRWDGATLRGRGPERLAGTYHMWSCREQG